jgi:hypothetical protein
MLRDRARAPLAFLLVLAGLGSASPAAAKLLVHMDLKQTDHLKAYGLAYWVLARGEKVEWLLNYRGGSFFLPDDPEIVAEASVRGVSFEALDGGGEAAVYQTIDENNMDVVLLEKAPRVAVYTPTDAEPWDDAVTLALTYADIPYEKVWDREVLTGKIARFDWLHLHHEDFTGQYGKFYASFHTTAWYQRDQAENELMAKEMGFRKVSELKKAVARALKEYAAAGGFLFAMCSATDTFDIALAAEGVDIVDRMYDGDPPAPDAPKRLDDSKCLAFRGFHLEMNPLVYEFSDIDTNPRDLARGEANDYFTLFDFSAKQDPVPTMLTQDHVSTVKGFLGQTTAFDTGFLKPGVVVLAQVDGEKEARYIHGNYGRGTFTFYGGHDPEDYQHAVGDPPTDLALHKSSPGYRLILNNILFPAAEKKKQKT